MDSLVYAPESINQHEQWQIGLPAHFPAELPNIAPLTNNTATANVDADNLPPQSLLLMHDISNLMAAITMAMGLGPGSPSYTLAQTFQPLINIAVGIQLAALQGGGGPASADQMALPASGNEYYQSGEATKSEKDPAEEYIPKTAAGKKRKAETQGARRQQQQPERASNREPRRRKTSSRFSDFVNIDDV